MKPLTIQSIRRHLWGDYFLVVGALLGCLSLWVGAQEQATEASVVLTDNVYLSGSSVHPSGPVNGDLFAAGGNVNVDHPVKGDAVLAGGQVNINSSIGDDVRIAGGQISLNGKVGGEALVAGGTINLGNAADIAGRTMIAGNEVTLSGKCAKDLKIYARKISLMGEVGGDARLAAEEIEILPGAKIAGALTYTSPTEIKIASGQVGGNITRAERMEGWGERNRHMGDMGEGWQRGGGNWFSPIWLLGLIAAAAVFLLVFPNATRAAEHEVDVSPWKSLGLGFALLFALPPLAIILMVTIIGIPIAMALLAIYAVLMLVGYLTAAIFIGDKAASALKKDAPPTPWKRIGFAALALIALGLIRYIPVAGALVVFAALLIGMGAWSLYLYHRYHDDAAV